MNEIVSWLLLMLWGGWAAYFLTTQKRPEPWFAAAMAFFLALHAGLELIKIYGNG